MPLTCPLCQANTELYQGQINKKFGTKFNMPVLYCSQLMVLAYGGSAKEAALPGNVIKARKLEEFAGKQYGCGPARETKQDGRRSARLAWPGRCERMRRAAPALDHQPGVGARCQRRHCRLQRQRGRQTCPGACVATSSATRAWPGGCCATAPVPSRATPRRGCPEPR